MARIIAYNFTSLNGYFKGINEDISWHSHAEDESKYSEEMLGLDNILLFGHKTYNQMASFWPTPAALDMFPAVAKGMNKAEKIVYSTQPIKVDWENTRNVSGDIVEKTRLLKQSSKKDMTILGSGSIISLFADHGLIDEFQIMIDPVALPSGTPVFKDIKRNIKMKFKDFKSFKSGVVLLNYQLMNPLNYAI